MIILEKEFVSGEGGYSQSPGPLKYVQLDRTDKVAVYQRWYADGRPKDFEVFKIKILPKGTNVFKVITQDDEEKYPGTSQFGFSAWSFTNEGAARKRFRELCKANDMEASGETEPVAAMIVPAGRFTTKELAEKNGIAYPEATLWIKENLDIKIVALGEERRNVKGPMSKVFGAKTT